MQSQSDLSNTEIRMGIFIQFCRVPATFAPVSASSARSTRRARRASRTGGGPRPEGRNEVRRPARGGPGAGGGAGLPQPGISVRGFSPSFSAPRLSIVPSVRSKASRSRDRSRSLRSSRLSSAATSTSR